MDENQEPKTRKYVKWGVVASAVVLAGMMAFRAFKGNTIPSVSHKLNDAQQMHSRDTDRELEAFRESLRSEDFRTVADRTKKLLDKIVSSPSMTAPIEIKNPEGKVVALLQAVELENFDRTIGTLHIQNMPGSSISWQKKDGSLLWGDKNDDTTYDLRDCTLVVETDGKPVAKVMIDGTMANTVTVEGSGPKQTYTFPPISQVHVNAVKPGQSLTVDSFIFSYAMDGSGSRWLQIMHSPGLSTRMTASVKDLQGAVNQLKR